MSENENTTISPEGAMERELDMQTEEGNELTQSERELMAIWKEVLELGDLGLDDDLFFIGGNSLLAVQIHNRIEGEMGAEELSIVDIFMYPTIRSLAAHLDTMYTSGTI